MPLIKIKRDTSFIIQICIQNQVSTQSMKTSFIRSSFRTKTRDHFHTSTRIRIRAYYSSDHSQKQIVRLLKQHHNVEISQVTVSRIIRSVYERRNKHRSERSRKISSRTTRYLARVTSREWTKRRLTWSQLVKSIDLNVSRHTVRRALKILSYRRCVTCERFFITQKQIKKRVDWVNKHKYWTINNWVRVVWSNKCFFMTKKRERLFVTRRSHKRYHESCIKSIYRSDRTSFMIWETIEWEYKFKLFFLQKMSSDRDINFKTYSEQVLKIRHANQMSCKSDIMQIRCQIYELTWSFNRLWLFHFWIIWKRHTRIDSALYSWRMRPKFTWDTQSKYEKMLTSRRLLFDHSHHSISISLKRCDDEWKAKYLVWSRFSSRLRIWSV